MLVLVRHGESTANAEGRLLGRADVPLTEFGWRQARALAAVLGRVAQLVSSPLQRAVDTASGLGLDLPVQIDERWVEIDYGALDGKPLAEVPVHLWDRWRAEPAYRPPGGESLAEVAERVSAACEQLFAHAGQAARAAGGDVVVVSHVSPIKAAVAWALGQGIEAVWRLQLSTGSVTTVGWGAGSPFLQAYNLVPSVD